MITAPSSAIRAKLEEDGKDVHFLHVTQDRQALICDCTYPAYSDDIIPIPLMFLHLCLEGGGQMRVETNLQSVVGDVSPGDIGILAPNSKGSGTWPGMRVITFGMSVTTVRESFGDAWPTKLRPDVLSRLFRDPLVEATMVDLGHTRAGTISDAGLIHAAHMIAHQLLDAAPSEEESTDVNPLGKLVLQRIDEMIETSLDRNVSVAHMAEIAGISRYHFSRRFKAATGQSPLQYALQKKLDHAANLLAQDEQFSVLSVAQTVGFNNPAHFSRAFRRQFGLAPRSWKFSQKQSTAEKAVR